MPYNYRIKDALSGDQTDLRETRSSQCWVLNTGRALVWNGERTDSVGPSEGRSGNKVEKIQAESKDQPSPAICQLSKNGTGEMVGVQQERFPRY